MNRKLGHLAMIAAVAAFLVGCSGSAQTATPSPTPTATPSPTPTATPSPPPSASPSPTEVPSPSTSVTASPTLKPELLDQAIGLIQALGGQALPRGDWEVGYYDTMDLVCQDREPVGDYRSGWYASDGQSCVVWGSDGTLVRLSFLNAAVHGSALDKSHATKRLTELMNTFHGRLGTPASTGAPQISYDQSFIHGDWARTIDGLPVTNMAADEGVNIWILSDGSLSDYTFAWSPVGKRPAKILTKSQAEARYAARFSADCANGKCTASLMWWGSGNGETLRLVWGVSLNALRCANGWFDAGTGELLDATGCV